MNTSIRLNGIKVKVKILVYVYIKAEGIKMLGKLSDVVVESILSGIKAKLTEAKENNEWNKLFINTGEFLCGYDDNTLAFQDDLMRVFSEENTKEIAKKLKGQSGFKLKELLNKELHRIMIDYEIETSMAETYIHQFMQVIFAYIAENMPDKDTQNFLLEWRQQELNEFNKLQQELKRLKESIEALGKTKKSIFTINEINAKIRRNTILPKIELDFFQIDDEQFLSQFKSKFNQERLYIIGKSREETIYCILNEIRKMQLDKITLVVTSEEGWRELENKNVSNTILVPFFYAHEITAISNNTNIFVFGEDEVCNIKERLVLRKRIRKNIISSLEEAGLNHEKAYALVEHTHGLYVPMKKRMFNGVVNRPFNWNSVNRNVLIAALLCGKWKECDGDKLIIEQLSGVDYDDFMKQLLPLMKGENPFVVKVNRYGGESIQLASIEDAWEELDSYITSDNWRCFCDLLIEVFSSIDPIFKFPVEKHFEASVYADKPDWSSQLKHGMIRTLIMRAYYRRCEENQIQVNSIVKRILDLIKTKEEWGDISQYFTELCEAAPYIVLERLEYEITSSTGMVELFKDNGSSTFGARHYYTNILWAIEQLLLQKQFVARAIKWLWEMDKHNIKYPISNSPRSILGVVFCAWINVSALRVEDKIVLAKMAIDKYENAWNIIYSELPGQRSTVCSTLNSPRYRDIDEPIELYTSDIHKTYIEYINMCVSNINGSVDKWEKIIGSMHNYDDALIERIFSGLEEQIQQIEDEGRIELKNKLRHEVYRHRYFGDADWAMGENAIALFEEMMEKINTENPIYEYLYLFEPKYDFPLLHPIPYNKEDSGDNRNKNEQLREEEIERGVQEFYSKGLCLELLLKIECKNNNSMIGECLAKYYGERKYSRDIVKLMLEICSNDKIVYDYISYFAGSDESVLNEALQLVKDKGGRTNLIVNLLMLESVNTKENSMITRESEEIKREYWSRDIRRFLNSDVETYIWAISECMLYGTIHTYLQLLFDAKNIIELENLYNLFINVTEVRLDGFDSMSSYYFEEIISILQKEYIGDNEKCNVLARIEWLFRNILTWGKMKCIQYLMKRSPVLYAQLVEIIYVKEGEDKEEKSSEQQDFVRSVFDVFYHAHFCPTEENGQVHYDKIKKWAEEFRDILEKQQQARLFSDLVGRLLPYSPVGSDNCMPCEAVRELIEEIYDEKLKSAYIIAEENKRGVYTPDAGKTELEKSREYKENADKLRIMYPKTAQIYDALSESYKFQANSERKCAEDEW